MKAQPVRCQPGSHRVDCILAACSLPHQLDAVTSVSIGLRDCSPAITRLQVNIRAEILRGGAMPVGPRWLRLDSRLLRVGSLKSILQIALDEVAGGGLDLHFAVVPLVPTLHLLADG